MHSTTPHISVVICTHNRREQILGLLHDLRRQTIPPGLFEVIVAADACTDGTADAVRVLSRSTPFPLRLLTVSARRAASARNAGARAARADILLFLDDDMEADPRLLSSHLQTQETAQVVIGYARPALPPSPTLWQLRAAEWWEDRFTAMERPDHRFDYSDLFTGNVSLRTRLFRALGGFDESLGRLEDYELGIRLIEAGARFAFARSALTHHRDAGDADRWLARLGMEGATFVALERKHPRMRGRFHRPAPEGTWSDRIRRFSRSYPVLARSLVPVVQRGALGMLEALKARKLWEKGLAALGELSYWSGVAGAGRSGVCEALPPQTEPETTAVLDSRNWSIIQPRTDPGSCRSVEVRLEGIPVGTITRLPGEEPLSELHLRTPFGNLEPDPWIVKPYTHSLARALEDCPAPFALQRLALDDPEAGPSFGADLRGLCLALFWKDDPVGFFPVRREEWERWGNDGLRSRVMEGARRTLRALASARAVVRTRNGAEAPLPSSLIIIVGDESGERGKTTLTALARQTVLPTREVCGPTPGDMPPGGEEVIVYLPAGFAPESAWLGRLLGGFADPLTGVVFPLVLPGGRVDAAPRRPLRGLSPPAPGITPRAIQPGPLFRDRLMGFRESSGCEVLAVRRGLLESLMDRNGGALRDARHILIAEKAVSQGYTVRYEPSAVTWSPASAGLHPSLSEAVVRGVDRGILLHRGRTEAAGEPGLTAARLLVRACLRAGRSRDVNHIRVAAAEIAAARRAYRTAAKTENDPSELPQVFPSP